MQVFANTDGADFRVFCVTPPTKPTKPTKLVSMRLGGSFCHLQNRFNDLQNLPKMVGSNRFCRYEICFVDGVIYKTTLLFDTVSASEKDFTGAATVHG